MNEITKASDAGEQLAGISVGEKTMIGGREVDAAKASEVLKTSIALVQQKCGDKVDMDLSKIHFKTMDGNIIGEAHEAHVEVDPIVFMHPAARMASAIAHELLHQDKDMMQEDLLDAMTATFFPNGFETIYDAQEMISFAEECDSNVETIYEMYYARDFDGIYAMHQLSKAGAHPSPEDSQAALESFRKIFPELNFVSEGHEGEWVVKPAELRPGHQESTTPIATIKDDVQLQLDDTLLNPEMGKTEETPESIQAETSAGVKHGSEDTQ